MKRGQGWGPSLGFKTVRSFFLRRDDSLGMGRRPYIGKGQDSGQWQDD